MKNQWFTLDKVVISTNQIKETTFRTHLYKEKREIPRKIPQMPIFYYTNFLSFFHSKIHLKKSNFHQRNQKPISIFLFFCQQNRYKLSMSSKNRIWLGRMRGNNNTPKKNPAIKFTFGFFKYKYCTPGSFDTNEIFLVRFLHILFPDFPSFFAFVQKSK